MLDNQAGFEGFTGEEVGDVDRQFCNHPFTLGSNHHGGRDSSGSFGGKSDLGGGNLGSVGKLGSGRGRGGGVLNYVERNFGVLVT